MTLDDRAREIHSFWFGDLLETGVCADEHKQRWWSQAPEFDQEVRRRFQRDVELAGDGHLDDWADEPRSALALILLCDQLTRNMYRGIAEMYFRDPVAVRVCRAGLERGFDQQLTPYERAFFYMPLLHSEDTDLQERSVELFEALAELGAEMALFCDFARRHARVVQRFGRFPHRNDILERTSTYDEIQFLQSDEAPF